ncbi:MAG: hypothetical protein RI563_00035 [Thiohalophilus sp.]|uniref:hypothetical protein n=1 Tax=Thiohalophilus sp. TaxID=3028392 RepID=UPI00286FD22F|nr:hypothetical protein [Thiohalophilus sp.]MDR9435234.1 hypothetical protein [Thiohalophilus sp.]
MTPTTELVISSHGLLEDEQEALGKALEFLGTSGLNYQLHSGNVQKAHLVVLNDETDSGKSALLRARAGQVKLVFSSTPRSGKNMILVHRPVNITLLQNVLIRVFGKMQDQLQHSLYEPRVKADADPRAEPASQDETLFTTLIYAKEKQKLLCLTLPDLTKLYINGQSNTFISENDINHLKKFAPTALSEIKLSNIDEAHFSAETRKKPIYALHRLLWTSGIYGSEGRLLSGHTMDRPVKLRAWPNFTRNDFLPQHLKMAAIIARRPTTLEQLVKQTGIARSDIINFYNAAYAVDLIEVSETRKIDDNTEHLHTPALSQARQGLLSKLASRLKLGT